jgi:DNA-binding winged helix-turn-helix (wHTH) protein/tetratricopeptide (TPR) repeat protein
MKRRETLPYTGDLVVLPSAYRFGPFRFDAAAYRLLSDGRSVPLSPKVMDLLHLLASRPSQLVTKEDILRELWPDVAVTDNAVTQVVSELRQALGDDPSSPNYVQTVPRRGYRFIAAVEVSAPVSPVHRVAPTPPAGAGKRAIAVSDFQNVTGDANDSWMAAGIAETVTNDLRALPDLRVIDRASVTEEARRASIDAARSCGLDLLVVGSYQKAGDRLRITARVIHAASGEAVAHSKADGAVEDVFQLQDAIVTQLLRNLHVPMTATAAARIGVHETSSLEAYRALTEGRLKLETLNPAHVPEAIRDFERAIALDPRYAHAYVGLAHAHLWLYEASRARNRPDTGELRAAISHGRRAVELDPGLGEGHAALALLLATAGRQSEAIEAGRAAVALEPNEWRHRFRLGIAAWGAERLSCFDDVVRLFPEFAYAYFGTAMVHVARRDLPGAEEILRQGLAVQQRGSSKADRFPANGLHWLLGLVRLAHGDVDQARAEFDRELTSRGSEMYAAEYAMDAYDGHGFACLETRDGAGAEAMFRKALTVYPDHARSLVGLSAALAYRGDRRSADQALDHAWRAIQELKESGRTSEAAMATSFGQLLTGRPQEAADTLLRLMDEAPAGFAGWTIPIEPLLAGLRGEAQFQTILERLAERAK